MEPSAVPLDGLESATVEPDAVLSGEGSLE